MIEAGSPMDRETILRALDEMGRRAAERELMLEFAVYGGAAMALVWEFRRSTRDIDIYVHGEANVVRDLAAEIASDWSLPSDWLNDGVKGFLSEKDAASLDFQGDYPAGVKNVGSGLRVFVPQADYMFAMKALSMRVGGEHSDIGDLQKLADHLDVDDAEQALDIVERYYPVERLPARIMFGLQELFDNHEDPKTEKSGGGHPEDGTASEDPEGDTGPSPH